MIWIYLKLICDIINSVRSQSIMLNMFPMYSIIQVAELMILLSARIVSLIVLFLATIILIIIN